MSPRLAFAVEAAYLAGRSTLSHFRTGVSVDLKADSSPVTRADKEAEAILRRLIRDAYPEDGIFGEEEGRSGDQDRRWVIDPIDGTKSFIAGVPTYTTLLSYEVDGEPEIGVIYAPALDEMCCAEAGGGAFWNGRPARASAHAGLAGTIICTGGHTSLVRRGLSDALARIGEDALSVRGWGDAYGHMLVATGRVHAMVDPVVERYDISAPAVVVREAGGVCTTVSGGHELGSDAVSACAGVHASLIEALRS
jgi:myo-inositol-1(or 4)-monophosphatase